MLPIFQNLLLGFVRIALSLVFIVFFFFKIYGSLLYLYMHLGTGCCHMLCGASSLSEYVSMGDTCCGLHGRALQRQVLLEPGINISFVNWTNSLYKTPYAIFLDHNKRCIIISCRGTLSFVDCLTDAILKEEKITIPPSTSAYVHSGMLKAARYVLEDIESRSFLKHLVINNPEYQLVVLGHSLGD